MIQEIQIQPRDVYEHFIHVKQPGTTLHWTFTTKKKNIHFGLFYRPGTQVITTTSTGLSTRYQDQSQTSIDERNNTLESKSSFGSITTTNNVSGLGILLHPTATSPTTATTTTTPTIGTVKLGNNIGDNTLSINHRTNKRLSQASSLHQQRRKSTATLHLIGNQFQEIIPISHTPSSEEKIHGSYTVPEPGNCVLIFDNTSSINTPKILQFTVTSDEPMQEEETATLDGSHEMAGFLLKKRRKRMQGWAKRWFELLPGGSLSYSVSPGGIKRGSIHITMTMITIYPKQRTIHLDTGTTVYHLKALTKEDFDRWVELLRRQRAIFHRDKNTGILVDGAWLLPDNRYRLTPNPTQQHIKNQPNGIDIVDNDDDEDSDIEIDSDSYFEQHHLEQDFHQMTHYLESIQTELKQCRKASANGPQLSSTDNNYSIPSSASSSTYGSPLTSPTATSSKRRFTFRRGSNQHQQQLSITTGNNDSHAITTTNNNSDISSSPHQQNAMITSAILDQWIQSVQRIMEIRDRMEVEYNRQHHHWIKMEKQFRYGSRDYQNQVSEFGTPRSRSFYSYHSTSQSDLYYDAEEFELILDEDDDADLVQENEDTDDSSSIEGTVLVAPATDSSISTSTTIKPVDISFSTTSSAAGIPTITTSTSQQQHPPASPLPGPTTTISSVIKRRKILPHPVAGKSVNLLGLLRKNIGKDLSTITMPISLNEPLNLLQRLCEELEYSELLDKANRMDDPLDRLMYVSAFAISGYASSQYRIGRKFWNPLLFETYECIRPDKGFKFISEKVSHRPNIMACHAESDNFTFWQSTEGSTKFWGKSMEFISEGTIHVTLPTSGDHFTYTKPSSHMRNMIFGTRYLEHLGQIKVINHKTGDYAVVHFKEARRQDGGDGYYYFGGGTQWERNEVEVLLYKNNKSMMQPVRKIVGKWSQSLSQDLGDQQYKLLWQAQPPTIDTPSDYYGFTQFCMELNEITAIEQDSLPVTDTRYRPDQRLFEQGHVDQAEKEKERVEIAQRERRNHFEAQGIMPTPIWFQQNEQDPSQWEYKGGYWEARASGQWPINIPTLW